MAETNLEGCKITSHISTESMQDTPNLSTMPNYVLIKIEADQSVPPPSTIEGSDLGGDDNNVNSQGYWQVELNEGGFGISGNTNGNNITPSSSITNDNPSKSGVLMRSRIIHNGLMMMLQVIGIITLSL